eukprot:3891870-Pyramimonas_sp.AAC.1
MPPREKYRARCCCRSWRCSCFPLACPSLYPMRLSLELSDAVPSIAERAERRREGRVGPGVPSPNRGPARAQLGASERLK